MSAINNYIYNVNENLPVIGKHAYLFTSYPFNPWKYEGSILKGIFEGEFERIEDEFGVHSELITVPKFKLKPDDVLCTGIQYWGYTDNEDIQTLVKLLEENVVKDLYEKVPIIEYGGTNNYYDIPANAKTLNDLIDYKNIPWNLANIFKAIYRLGDKPKVEIKYDLEKIRYYIDRELKKQGIDYNE